MMVLDKINKPNDIKKINPSQYEELAADIRQFLVEKTSVNGGHLASNLGVVELTMALHLSFDFPEDKVIFDVGHQAYTHKILSGRKDMFDTLRCYGGLSGFPKRRESDFDVFDTGHSTTSISVGMGLVAARNLKGENNYVISVIGDGSLTGGMAYEAFNNMSNIKGNYIIVLNDNNMSISPNVGGISKVLGDVRTTDSYYDLKQGVRKTLKKLPKGDVLVDKISHTKANIKHMLVPNYIFEDMGLTYLGPVDGHDITKLLKIFKIAKRIDKPVIVHVVTRKGKGYKPAEANPSAFHGVGAFDIRTGKALDSSDGQDYSAIFGEKLTALAAKDKRICAITAAMPGGTGLSVFQKRFPSRCFDVGIAEEHAVTFAAGLAAGGMKPVVAVYSSFLQRAYDQILHDVCIGALPVVFAVDRAGIVGRDGETHQGIFDLSYLSTIPGMTVVAPSGRQELFKAMEFAFCYGKPIAIRYPRGVAQETDTDAPEYELGRAKVIAKGNTVAVVTVGNMMEEATVLCCRLKEAGLEPTLVDARFVKPVDEQCIAQLADTHRLVVTLEENVWHGGFGEQVLKIMSDGGFCASHMGIALPDKFLEHGTKKELREKYGLDAESIAKRIRDFLDKDSK